MKLTKTKAQLEALGYPMIGIQLQDGNKYFGRLTKCTAHKIYFRDKNGDELDVPRMIISRALLLLEGGGGDDEQAAISKQNRS